MSRALLMEHDTDPKDEIWGDVRDYLDDVTPLGTQIIVAVYVRPDKTSSGIYIPKGRNQIGDEDGHQGKVGLVIKMGPLAFTEDDSHRWGDVKPKVGDWVAFNVGDTWSFELGKRRCRQIEDVSVRQILARPDIVY